MRILTTIYYILYLGFVRWALVSVTCSCNLYRAVISEQCRFAGWHTCLTTFVQAQNIGTPLRENNKTCWKGITCNTRTHSFHHKHPSLLALPCTSTTRSLLLVSSLASSFYLLFSVFNFPFSVIILLPPAFSPLSLLHPLPHSPSPYNSHLPSLFISVSLVLPVSPLLHPSPFHPLYHRIPSLSLPPIRSCHSSPLPPTNPSPASVSLRVSSPSFLGTLLWCHFPLSLFFHPLALSLPSSLLLCSSSVSLHIALSPSLPLKHFSCYPCIYPLQGTLSCTIDFSVPPLWRNAMTCLRHLLLME